MSSRDHHRKRDRSRSPAPAGGRDNNKDDDRHRHRRSEPSKSSSSASRHRDDDRGGRGDRGDRGDRERERDRGGDRDKGDKDRYREPPSRHQQSSSSSRRKHSGSEGEEEDPKKRSRRDTEKAADREGRSSRDKEKDSKSRDKERDDRNHRSSKSGSSRRDRDREDDRRTSRHRRRGRSASGSGSGSESGSGSGSESESASDSASESEEDEMIKKAKSMIKTISEDDYFTKSSEFRLWLRQAKKKYFEDLTTDEARKLFRKFVRRWNDFELDESYYKGVRSSQIPTKSMTKYQWKFSKTIDKADLKQVESVKDSIDTMTNVRFANEVGRLTGKTSASALEAGSGAGAGVGARKVLGPSMPPPALPPARGAIGPRRPMTADEVAEKEDQDSRSRQAYRADQKRARKDKEVLLEELVPKATGREAMLEKRRAQTAYHRQERSPDVELPEQDLMGAGNGGDDYKSMLAAEKRRKEAREARRHGGGHSVSGPEPQSSSSSSAYGAAAGPGAAQGGSVLGAKQQAYKEKEAKQMEEFRKLWAQTQAAKGGL